MGVPLEPIVSGPNPGPLPAPGAVRILGIEIVQSIQSLNNSVALIQGKPTLARVYLDPTGFAANAQLSGEIAVSPAPGAPAQYVSSMNAVGVSNGPYASLSDQRVDLSLSLNFVLPSAILGWQALTVAVTRVFVGGQDQALNAGQAVSVALTVAPPLRIRAIGLRYSWTKPDGSKVLVSPQPFEFDYLRSFLLRAYPVASVDWSQIVVQAAPAFSPPFSGPPAPDGSDPIWQRKLDMAHNQLAALRAKDVDAGADGRTHYYGLVSDASAGLFFRGAAKDVPTSPNPAVVAVGPTGDPSQYPSLAWDTDRTYGDWYGAHELAHTFGRFHPGFCNQDASDPQFPYPDGRIGDPGHGDMIGLDYGDPALGIATKNMRNDVCHDLMTYCDNQWISAYTYGSVLARLQAENAAFGP